MEPGTLPAVSLPSETVELAGQSVPIRSLTRGEVLYMRQTFTDNVDQEFEAEAYVISKGSNITIESAREWIDSSPSDVVETLNQAILMLSGLVDKPDPN